MRCDALRYDGRSGAAVRIGRRRARTRARRALIRPVPCLPRSIPSLPIPHPAISPYLLSTSIALVLSLLAAQATPPNPDPDADHDPDGEFRAGIPTSLPMPPAPPSLVDCAETKAETNAIPPSLQHASPECALLVRSLISFIKPPASKYKYHHLAPPSRPRDSGRTIISTKQLSEELPYSLGPYSRIC